MIKKSLLLIAVVVATTFPITGASAYIGPGAGVALIGTFFGFAAAIIASVLMVLAWPAWIIWKKYKAKKSQKEDVETDSI